MRSIAVLSQKGGSGKTTLAVHLAVMAEAQGHRVALVDLDPQRSAADWWKARKAETPRLVEASAGQLPEILDAAKADGYTLTVADTAPHQNREAALAARAADLILIPCRPGILDLRAIGATVELVQALKKPAAVVLNACPPSVGFGEAALTAEARRGLTAYRLPVCPVSITQRVALSHALIDGRAVSEFEPEGKAAREIRTLWDWLKGST